MIQFLWLAADQDAAFATGIDGGKPVAIEEPRASAFGLNCLRIEFTRTQDIGDLLIANPVMPSW